MSGGRRAGRAAVVAAVGAVSALLLGAAPASAADRFAEVGGNGPSATCPLSDPCSIVDAINNAASADVVTLLGGLPPTPYTTSTELVVPSNVTVHGAIGARPLIQTNAFNGPGVKLNAGSVLRDVVVAYTGSNFAAIELVGGGTLERVTGRASFGSSDGGCGTRDGGTPVIRDSVCWHDGPFTDNPVGGVTARNDSAVAQTLTLRNVTAISSDDNNEAGIFAIESNAALTVNATNVIAFSENGFDVATSAALPATAVNLDHSNYNTESDADNVITNPGTGSPNFNQTAAPAFVNRLGGDFHQHPTSAATIDLGTATGVLPMELDFDGQPRTIGAAPDIGADEFQHLTTTAVACNPTSLTLGAGSSTCTATVTDTSSSSPIAPTGTVGFASNDAGTFSGGVTCTLGTPSGSQASCQLTYTPTAVGSGSHQIIGTYAGDSGHTQSQGTDRVDVLAAPGGGGGAQKPSNSFTLGALTRNKKKGVAFLAVEVPGPGQLALSGNGVKTLSTARARSSLAVSGPGTAALKVKATGKKRAKLLDTGKVTVNANITYTPTGGDPNTQSRKVKLKKNL